MISPLKAFKGVLRRIKWIFSCKWQQIVYIQWEQTLIFFKPSCDNGLFIIVPNSIHKLVMPWQISGEGRIFGGTYKNPHTVLREMEASLSLQKNLADGYGSQLSRWVSTLMFTPEWGGLGSGHRYCSRCGSGGVRIRRNIWRPSLPHWKANVCASVFHPISVPYCTSSKKRMTAARSIESAHLISLRKTCYKWQKYQIH